MSIDRSDPQSVLRYLECEPLLFDGAMGTTLNAAEERDWEATEEVTLRHPERLLAVYRSYVEAGADVITTNTLGGNLIRLQRAGLADQVAEVNRRAAELARQAVGRRAWVAGDIGQSGDFLEPLGGVTPEQMQEAFEVQIEHLVAGGVDLLLCETFSDVREMEIAIRAAKRAGLPVFATMTYDQNLRTMMGVAPAEGMRACEDAGADVVGCNCGNGAEEMDQVLAQMVAAGPRRPLMAQSNAGTPELVDGQVCYRYPPEKLVDYARRWLQRGVQVIGACCGSTAQTTRLLREMIDQLPVAVS